MPHTRKLTSELPDPPVVWYYLPLTHYKQLDGRHHLRLTDHDGSVIRTTIADPEHVALLEPYLHLYELEQRDPWTHGPAFVPVEELYGSWQFSTAGALYDRRAATGSGTADAGNANPYRRPTFQ